MPAQDPPLCRFATDDLTRGVVLAIEGTAPLTSATLFEPYELDEYAASDEELARTGSAVIQQAAGGYDDVVILRGDAFCYFEPTVRAEMEGEVIVVTVQEPALDPDTACDAAEVDVAIGLTFDRSAGLDSDVEYRG